jgi:hypothetical protein
MQNGCEVSLHLSKCRRRAFLLHTLAITYVAIRVAVVPPTPNHLEPTKELKKLSLAMNTPDGECVDLLLGDARLRLRRGYAHGHVAGDSSC